MRHHRIAAITIAAAAVLIVGCGLLFGVADHVPAWHGIFCGLANGVTDGCDVAPATGWAYAITAVEYLAVVSLVGVTFSLITSALTRQHVRKAADEIKTHVAALTTVEIPPARMVQLEERIRGLADAHLDLTNAVRELVPPLQRGEEQRAAGPQPPAPRKPRAGKTTRENT